MSRKKPIAQRGPFNDWYVKHPDLSVEDAHGARAGWDECKARCLAILESHLVSHTCPPDTEPNALVIDTAALEEIKKL